MADIVGGWAYRYQFSIDLCVCACGSNNLINNLSFNRLQLRSKIVSFSFRHSFLTTATQTGGKTGVPFTEILAVGDALGHWLVDGFWQEKYQQSGDQCNNTEDHS